MERIHYQKFRPDDGFVGYILTLFHNKRMLSGILSIGVVLVGVLFATRIRREAMPLIESNFYRIQVAYPGASPVQVEKEAITPIEDLVKNITGIKEYSSTSSQGSGNIIISVDEDAPNQDEIGDEIFRQVSLGNIPGLADGVEKVSVRKATNAEIRVYTLAVLRDNPDEISELAFNQNGDLLAARIKGLSGVSQVEMEGYREQQIEIDVNPNALLRSYVDMNTVVNAIRSRNVRSTAGILEDPKNYRAIVTISEYENLEQLRNTVLRAGFDGNRVLLRDVAQVRRVFPPKREYIRIDGKEAITLGILKTPSADIVATAKAVKDFLQGENLLPQGMRWVEINDEGHNVDEVSRVLLMNGLIGFCLILLILFLFLDFTTAFWTAVGLPITMTLTLAFMGASDLTVNYLTLTAMITMLGMLVDHGIVISETIYARRAKGFSALRSCIDGLKSVFWPVVVTVSTTIFAFIPLLMIGGVMGRFTRFFPIIVTVMLSFSFLEACFLLVSHLLHSRAPRNIRRKQNPQKNKRRLPQDTWFSPIIRSYQCLLRWVLRFRWPCSLGFLLLLAGGFFYALPTMKNFVLFDDTGATFVEINYSFAAGTTLEKAQEDAKQLEEKVAEITPTSQIKYIWNDVYTSGWDARVRGQIMLYLVEAKARSMEYNEYTRLLEANLLPFGRRSRERLEAAAPEPNDESTQNDYALSAAQLAQVPVLFENVRVGFGGGAGPPNSAGVSVRLYSSDENELDAAGKMAMEMLEAMPGTRDIQNSNEDVVEQIRVELDYAQMARFGVSLAAVNSTLRTAFQGQTATESRSGNKTIKYIVRLQEPYRKSINTLLRLTVQTATGQYIPLSRFARLRTEYSQPNVRHFNGNRTLRISGSIDGEIEGVTTLSINTEFTNRFPEIKAKYPSVSLDLSGGEFEFTQNFLRDIVPAFAVASILVLLILVLLFDSFLQPMVIMGAVPFGLMGGVVALQLHGLSVGFMAVLGFLGLIGVVVNDSVVMVEFINHIVYRYPHTRSKLLLPMVLKGAGRRLRAVVLTTLTTVLGLFPTIYGLGGDPGFVRPIVLVLGYGLIVATLITLFFIPAAYMMQLDISYWVAERKAKWFQKQHTVAVDEQRLAKLEALEEQELPQDPWV